jgi:ATP-dependent helicase/DNAse subunit B
MGRVLEWWRDRLPLRPVVVAPTEPDALELSTEMVRRAGALVGQSLALTFDGLVRLVLQRSPRYVTDFERSLILSRLLRDTPVQALGHAVRLPGLAKTLGALLQELGESGRTPDELDRVLAQWASTEPGAAPLARDIRRLAAAYAQTCDELGVVDRPTAVRQAARAAAGWTRPVALYGFTSFTPGQRALVTDLSRQGAVLLTFSHDRLRAVNLCTRAEVSWWEKVAVEVVDLAPLARAYSSPAVAYLERYLMSDPPRPEPPPASSGSEGVRFLLASGQRNEAELAAQQISDLIREGFRPGDIAVVVRRVGKWRALLGHVFDSCGIPYQVDDRRPLGQTGIGHAFLSALRGVALDDPGSVLAYLRSPYSGLALEDVSDLELQYRRGTAQGARVLICVGESMIPGSMGFLRKVIDAGPDGPRLDLAVAADLTKRMLIAGLRDSTVGRREKAEDARAFRAVQEALATLTGFAVGSDGVGSLEPRAVLHSLVQFTVPGTRSGDRDAVQILSVQRARARRFAVVVLLGLVEGEFPGRPDTASLLTSGQRTDLDRLGGGLFTLGADQEDALFVSAVSRAWQLLLLSARDADDGGGESMPSHFWYAAKELLGVGEHGHEVCSLADQVFKIDSAPSLRHYLRACALLGCVPRAAGGSEPAHALARSWRRPPSRLTASAVLAELEAAESFSPSSLEAYLGCPFAWFVERVIGVDDLDFALDGRFAGQLLHSALSAAYRELASAGALPLVPQRVPEAERLASAIIDGLVESDDCPGTAAERRLAGSRLKSLTRNLFDMETRAGGSMVLSATEVSVGGRQGVDIGGLRIRGRIDRVEAAPGEGELFVLDYKSGSIPAASAVGTERALQLPLYLMALAAERPEVHVIGGAYLSLSEKRRAGVVAAGSEGLLGSGVDGCRVLDDARAEEFFRTAREAALVAVAGMRAGIIEPRGDGQCPSWCRLGPVCRIRRGGYKA